MADRFPFRTALVTGASSGIGAAFATVLGERGVPTVLVARRADRMEELADRFDGFEVVAADLTTPGGQGAVVERLGAEPVDLVVNNAGFGTSGSFVDLDPERLAREVELNVAALTRLSHAALSVMVPRRRGWLLNVSSVAGFQPAPRLAVYAATKAYVTSLTESLHEEVAGSGVHVTALCPGLTPTEFQQVASDAEAGERVPAPLWTSVEQVVRSGLDGVIANRALAVPGFQYQALTAITNVTPRWLRRKVATAVQTYRRPD